MKIVNVLSLGAGVQSTVVALMMHRPIEEIDFNNLDASVDKARGQLRLGFDGECEGMCGL